MQMQEQEQHRSRELEIQRLRLVHALFGRHLARAPRLNPNAYFSFLDHQITGLGRQRLAPLLVLAGYSAVDASLQELLQIIADVATVVQDDNNPSRSFHSILQAILQQYGTTESSLEESTRSSCWQAIFAILCWLGRNLQVSGISHHTGCKETLHKPPSLVRKHST
jgi:hypothetical protein